MTIPQTEEAYSPVVYAYAICASFTFLCGVAFLFLGRFKYEEKVRHYHQSYMENREEDSLTKILPLIVLICIYYFLCLTTEGLFGNFVFAVAVCSQISMKPWEATLLNTLYWSGYGTARFLLIFFMKQFKPQNIIIATTIGCGATLLVEIIWGKHITWISWAVSFLFGLFVSLLYPTGVSWTSQYTNMCGKYTPTFCFGASLGAMIMMPIGGLFFEMSPLYVMYLNLVSLLALILTFAAMVLVRKKIFGKS